VLRFLQAAVTNVVDNASAEDDMLRDLLTPLLARRVSSSVTPSSSLAAVTPDTYKARGEVFQQLTEIFLQEAKERQQTWQK
jgi:hypothetical protein